MLHSRLSNYLSEVEQDVLRCSRAYIEQYTEEILTPARANLRMRLRFERGHLLEINEAVVVEGGEITWLDYRYHCQDEQNQLVFRYDSAPHYPDLDNFPYHKHTPDDVIACDRPPILEVLKEANDTDLR